MDPLRSANTTVTCFRSPSRALREVGWSVRRGRTSLRTTCSRSSGRRESSLTRPDETALSILVYLRVRIQEFVLEIVEDMLVQGKLALEGAVGHTAAPLEHG